MPLSMSSRLAMPDSNIRIAESRYGISRALTTKPERSWARIACLSSTFCTTASARFMVSSDVVSAGISSTSRCTGAGLKKWMPMTWSGRDVATASFTSGMEEVFEARIASGRVTTWSRTWKISVLTCSFSTTASITRSRSANSPRSVVKLRRARVSSRSSAVILPRSAALERELCSRVRPISSASPVVSATLTSRPLRAHTSAMPAPIWPQPTTPTRAMSAIESVTSCLSLIFVRQFPFDSGVRLDPPTLLRDPARTSCGSEGPRTGMICVTRCRRDIREQRHGGYAYASYGSESMGGGRGGRGGRSADNG